MDDDIVWASATDMAQRIRSKALSQIEVLEAHLDRIESVNSQINAIVTKAEDARQKARDAEMAVRKGVVLDRSTGSHSRLRITSIPLVSVPQEALCCLRTMSRKLT